MSSDLVLFRGRALITSDNMTYTPFVMADGRVGYYCDPVDGPGKPVYLYLNPNTFTSDEQPNVVLYMGESNDPCQDTALHHYDIGECVSL